MTLPTQVLADASPERLTLIQAGRKHWRRFAPAWAFPVALLLSTYIPPGSAFSTVVSWSLTLVFFWVFFRAAGPGLRRELPYGQAVFWGMLVPFAIWMAAVFINLEILSRLSRSGAT